MRGDKHVLARLEKGLNLLLEVLDGSGRGHLEALAVGRGHVVGAAPDVDLLRAVFVGGLLLVQPLQLAIHALVELEGADDGDGGLHSVLAEDLAPLDGALVLGVLDDGHLARGVLGHGDERGHLRAHELADEDDVDGDVGDALPGLDGLVDAVLREGDVHAAGEKVALVPLGLAVAHQRQGGAARAARVVHAGRIRAGGHLGRAAGEAGAPLGASGREQGGGAGPGDARAERGSG
mmetsp:Transcript_56449/g.178607  ORF Transcript_56449/g.178607 Transcript_56449/m.178607 type:complete len:235 (+) Transcript_56449:530-1234(+)